MGNEIFDTGDTLANAIMASFYYHKRNYAVILSGKLSRREEMRRGQIDDMEELPMSDIEFGAWVEKHNLIK